MKIHIGLLSLVMLLSACTASEAIVNRYSADYVFNDFIEKQSLLSVDRIAPFKLRGYRVLSSQLVAITGANGKHFLLESTDTCEDFEHAIKVYLLTREKNIVQANTDKFVRVGEDFAPCNVSNIFKLHEVQYEELARLQRKINPTHRYEYHK
ncbi:DUF6491 family protein [Alteromonadaceae bacterium BrNp21-10]|nr:DUF6491 family protein [Alteromonadaceae bacterium BrNp21-10]